MDIGQLGLEDTLKERDKLVWETTQEQ